MNLFDTIIISIIEGLTEFLPVSSTGHMIIGQKLLGVESSEFVKAFTVNIQFGAILSVVVMYWKRFFILSPKEGLDGCGNSWFDRFIYRFDFYIKLLVAFIPAAIIGFLLGDFIDSLLENVSVVASTLILGGIFMIHADKWFNKPTEDQTITNKKAFKIGLCQCIAMIPGVSRSMATIIGGMSQKLTREKAAEFSFFLAVPTMFAASAYKLLGTWKVLFESDNIVKLFIGNIVAFIVALLAIKWFISFVSNYGFKAFGWYRIIVGVLILCLIIAGVDLSIL